ncbi:hypothetical protein CHS0354_022918 [Potamilus streckersoni]|uniref:Uncharacterized protein n=1 Tax=Potamilus streckersoni TaxID=2493646 RepID=A0AAE0S2I1_9BIVA|nr:hypothetical protein CHS0354_022918 [Potamilus streckersoni]
MGWKRSLSQNQPADFEKRRFVMGQSLRDADGSSTTSPIKLASANDKPAIIPSSVPVSSNGPPTRASSSNGVQLPPEKSPSIPPIPGASSSGSGAHISVTTDPNKLPGETIKSNITTPGEKNGVKMLSANVLMLLILVSVCLEIYFR